MSRPTARSWASNKLHALALLAGMGLGTGAIAQPVSLNPDDPSPTLIAFKAEPKLGEKVGRVEGMVDAAGRRFYLDGLDVMSPLAIQVLAKDETRPIKVALHRFFWKTAEMKGETDSNGDWTFVGRVHDEVGIELRASEPSEFYILAWQGPAMKPTFAANLFTASEAANKPAAVAGSFWMIGIIAVLALVIGVLALKLRRRQTVALTLLVLTTGLAPQPAVADPESLGFPARLARTEARIEQVYQTLTARMDQTGNIIAGRLTSLEAADRTLTARMDQTGNIIAGRLEDLDAADRMLTARMDQTGAIIADRFAALDGHIETLYMLVAEDATAIPDPTHGGIAPMPSRCFDDPACASCFAAANTRLSDRLAQYERLRVIYQTNERFIAKMVQMGDAVSGWHQLEQAAWYATKAKIMKSQDKLTLAYNNKYREFNGKLLTILQEFGRCEDQHGLDDWYNRYGVFFYNSLIASYRLS